MNIMNVTPQGLGALTDQIKDALARRERSKEDWVSATIELCECLAKARAKFTNDKAFGSWFDGGGFGLDKNDRRYLECLIDTFSGGPTGIEAMAATMNIAVDTLSDEIEPYLLREQFIIRTPRGRMATPRAFTTLNRAQPKAKDDKSGLFD